MKIALTGLRPGEGTTTVAVNLAIMLSQTEGRITYIDCNTGTSRSRVLLNPEIREHGPLTVSGGDSPVSGKLIHGRAWGIDFHGVRPDRKINCDKTEICRELNEFAGNGVTIFDQPAGSIKTVGSCSCHCDILVVVATPETLASEIAVSLLDRKPGAGSLRRAVLINKNKDGESLGQFRINGFNIAGSIPFDKRIEAADRNGVLALELIPDIRPCFGSIAQKIIRLGGITSKRPADTAFSGTGFNSLRAES
jgi:MinD superfamily P-loop ATPase